MAEINRSMFPNHLLMLRPPQRLRESIPQAEGPTLQLGSFGVRDQFCKCDCSGANGGVTVNGNSLHLSIHPVPTVCHHDTLLKMGTFK